MEKREQKSFLFLLISQAYCLIFGWYVGRNEPTRINYPTSAFFWFFLTWWCVWNCFLTIAFLTWKLLKKTKNNSYSTQIISLITMISNFLTAAIYAIGLILWLTTEIKIVPIPTRETTKIIQWWLYSPLWHLIAPVGFIYWFFRYTKLNLLKKKLRLTFLLCLVQPMIYFVYCFARTSLSKKEYLTKPFHRWPYFFFSSKKMSEKLGLDRDYRFVWKIILVLFWFSLFSLIVYLTLRYRRKIKGYLSSKKQALIRKKSKISSLRIIGKRKKLNE